MQTPPNANAKSLHVASNQFHIACKDQALDCAPANDPHIASLELASHVRPFDVYRFLDVSQHADKDGLVEVRLFDHADSARSIIQGLKLGRELREEGSGVMI
jgi:hypothetical protein